MKKKLKLSLIIPAYNEESHLKECLQSIAKQSVKPDEVIVIDNNSTDNTALIAGSFEFVKVVSETQQGLIPARNRGFKESTGDLVGRLDADSVLPEDWVSKVHQQFEDKTVSAITGPALIFFDIHFPQFLTKFWSKVYFMHAKGVFRFQVLWGPNMVIRRSLWNKIKPNLCLDDKLVHEDQDMSVVINSYGEKIKYLDDLVIYADGARFLNINKAFEYQKRKRNTLRIHKEKGTLKKARKNGLMPAAAFAIWLAVLPFGFLSMLLCLIHQNELKIKNKQTTRPELE